MRLSPSSGGTKGTSGLCPACGVQGGEARLAASAFPAKGPRRSRPQVERSLWNIILASYAFYTVSLFCEQIFCFFLNLDLKSQSEIGEVTPSFPGDSSLPLSLPGRHRGKRSYMSTSSAPQVSHRSCCQQNPLVTLPGKASILLC